MSWVGIADSGNFLFTTDDEDLIRYGELDGDVIGGIGATQVVGLVGFALPTGAPVSGQIIKFDGSQWAYAPDESGLTSVTPHALLGPVHNDTVPGAPVRGGLIVANSGNLWEQLALGAAGQVLYSDGNDALYTQLGQNTPFENGLVGAPAVTFLGDLTTGAYLPTSGSLGLVANGDELITLDGINTQITLDGGQVVETRTGGTTTLTAADYVYLVNAGSTTVTLPASPTAGQTHIIKDTAGNATVPTPITIQGNGNNIDGNGFIRIRRRYGSFTLVYNGTEWNII